MIIHPLKPIYDKNSKILILGSFPSKISREYDFYYANPTNRFWKIMSKLFDIELSSIESKVDLLYKNHIALWDVIYSCEIAGSSDLSIKNVIPNDIDKILNNSMVKTIFVTGKAAFKYYNKYLKDKLNIEAILLPSSSSANASFSLESLIEKYKVIIEYLK